MLAGPRCRGESTARPCDPQRRRRARGRRPAPLPRSRRAGLWGRAAGADAARGGRRGPAVTGAARLGAARRAPGRVLPGGAARGAAPRALTRETACRGAGPGCAGAAQGRPTRGVDMGEIVAASEIPRVNSRRRPVAPAGAPRRRRYPSLPPQGAASAPRADRNASGTAVVTCAGGAGRRRRGLPAAAGVPHGAGPLRGERGHETREAWQGGRGRAGWAPRQSGRAAERQSGRAAERQSGRAAGWPQPRGAPCFRGRRPHAPAARLRALSPLASPPRRRGRGSPAFGRAPARNPGATSPRAPRATPTARARTPRRPSAAGGASGAAPGLGWQGHAHASGSSGPWAGASPAGGVASAALLGGGGPGGGARAATGGWGKPRKSCQAQAPHHRGAGKGRCRGYAVPSSSGAPNSVWRLLCLEPQPYGAPQLPRVVDGLRRGRRRRGGRGRPRGRRAGRAARAPIGQEARASPPSDSMAAAHAHLSLLDDLYGARPRHAARDGASALH
jgi:hypothetical protein